jgi:hypothetical protein
LEGARAASEAVIDWIERLGAAAAASVDLGEGFAVAREAIERLAHESGCEPGELACTLTIVVVGREQVWLGSVGDCIVVGRDEQGAIETFIPAERGEYLNEVVFLTSEEWEEDLRTHTLGLDRLSALAVSTDGLQFKILSDLNSGAPFAPFFEDLFVWARTPQAGSADLLTFLETLDAQSGDDKTLLVAVPVPESDDRVGRRCR